MDNNEKINIKCPCCGKDAAIKIEKSRWGKETRVIITHKKWQEGYK